MGGGSGFAARSFSGGSVRQFSGGNVRQFSGGSVRQFSGGNVRQFSGSAVTQFHNVGPRHDGRRDRHHRFRGPIVVFASPYFYDYGYDYGYSYNECYQLQRVRTPYGWRNQWVNVCYDEDY